MQTKPKQTSVKMRKSIISLALACLTTTGMAQNDKKDFLAFNHLDLGVTLGTTGIGFDLAAPFGDYVQVRTGFEFMPHFEKSLHFDIQSFAEDGSLIETQFDQLSERLESFTGYKADQQVKMNCKPTFWNFKLLFDVFPFRNKHWHLTAGFHWGPSQIAEAINDIEDAPSLVAVNIYNNIYEKVIEGENVFGDFDVDPDIRRQIKRNGRMGIHLGDYADGTPYLMEPDENCTVSAKVTVNSFKPYLGFGYGGRLFKNDNRYHVSFDAGVMFWGGTPAITTHDGTNLSKDVSNISGKVGDYVDLISSIKVFPVINVRFTQRLF